MNLANRLRFLLRYRIILLWVVHLVLLSLVYNLAYQFRFDFNVPDEIQKRFLHTLPWVVGIQLLAFSTFGSFHGWWRYVTFADLASLLRVVTISVLVIAFVDYFFVSEYQISRTVLLLDWIGCVLVIGGLRSVWRLKREHFWPSFRSRGKRPVFLVGADQCNISLARQIHDHPRLGMHVIGYLDENRAYHGTRLGGIPIVGSTSDAVALARDYCVNDILVVAQSISGPLLRSLMEQCREAGIYVRMLPRLDEMLETTSRLHIRDINIHDLLRREPVKLDAIAIRDLVQGKRILVTGAGGSIASEICRQLINCNPESLILVERAENSLFHLERELIAMDRPVTLHACVTDICDRERLQAVFAAYRPHLVFHAAAHKHVPLMELNPGEAIANNVLGTRTLVEVAEEYLVKRFVFISTDKAVNPTSVMGVTKCLCERLIHAFGEESTTKFVIVRFGNVLASNGSVVPTFQRQIEQGGPLTITHPEMRRFFMTIPEASQLVLQAAAMGKGGEVYVLDMGEQILIYDLARDLIRLSGLRLEDIEIQFVGTRPGEKLYEELHVPEEQLMETSHPKVKAAYQPPCDPAEIFSQIDSLQQVLFSSDKEIRQKLKELVPTYRPTSGGLLEPVDAADALSTEATSGGAS